MVSISNRAKALTAVSIPLALLTAACDDEADTAVYCTNEQNQVIDDCDDGHGGNIPGTYIWYGPGGGTAYTRGQVINGDSGFTRISSGDSTARSNIGLSPGGSIKSGGTSVGGIGKGSPGVHISSGG